MLYGRIKIAKIETYKDQPLWQRPVSGIVGRAMSPIYSLLSANEDFMKPGPIQKDIQGLDKYYNTHKQDAKDINLAIYPNAAHPIDNLTRIWQRKGLSIPGKMIGSVLSPVTDLATALTRGDHYNPYAHSITSYVNTPAVKLHEIGHAEDFQKSKLKTLYALSRGIPIANIPATLYQEWVANREGGKKLKQYIKDKYKGGNEFELRKGDATLTGGMASYTLGMLGLPPVGGISSVITRLGGRKHWTR